LTEAPRAPSERRFGAFSTIHSIGDHGRDAGLIRDSVDEYRAADLSG
jgi:hypothetical protein